MNSSWIFFCLEGGGGTNNIATAIPTPPSAEVQFNTTAYVTTIRIRISNTHLERTFYSTCKFWHRETDLHYFTEAHITKFCSEGKHPPTKKYTAPHKINHIHSTRIHRSGWISATNSTRSLFSNQIRTCCSSKPRMATLWSQMRENTDRVHGTPFRWTDLRFHLSTTRPGRSDRGSGYQLAQVNQAGQVEVTNKYGRAPGRPIVLSIRELPTFKVRHSKCTFFTHTHEKRTKKNTLSQYPVRNDQK